MLVVKNILRWLFPTQTKSTNLITEEDHEYYERYIDHQMQEYIDEEQMLRSEGEQVPLRSFLKDKEKNETD